MVPAKKTKQITASKSYAFFLLFLLNIKEYGPSSVKNIFQRIEKKEELL